MIYNLSRTVRIRTFVVLSILSILNHFLWSKLPGYLELLNCSHQLWKKKLRSSRFFRPEVFLKYVRRVLKIPVGSWILVGYITSLFCLDFYDYWLQVLTMLHGSERARLLQNPKVLCIITSQHRLVCVPVVDLMTDYITQDTEFQSSVTIYASVSYMHLICLLPWHSSSIAWTLLIIQNATQKQFIKCIICFGF